MRKKCYSSCLPYKIFALPFHRDNGSTEVILRPCLAMLSFSAVLDSDQVITSPAWPPFRKCERVNQMAGARIGRATVSRKEAS
jgi:hypothetical protein